MPLTISALTMPTDAPASLGETPFSGKITNQVVKVGGSAPRQTAATLEVGCGSGVIMRELARRTAGANRLIGGDMSPYLLREVRALARRDRLRSRIASFRGPRGRRWGVESFFG